MGVEVARVLVPYSPRVWAREFHASLLRFSVLVLHRRAGKTTAILNHHQRAALDDELERRRLVSLAPTLEDQQIKELISPPGGRHYAHIMPLHTQAKSVAWDKLKYYSECIPGVKRNESELLIRYPNGNKVQLFGADNPDAFRGMAFSGVSFDEYSQMAGNIFSEVISKSLADHLGYGIFCGTVKGKDQLFEYYEKSAGSSDWFRLWQDIDRSIATEDGATIKVLETAMADDVKQVSLGLMTQDELDQEWYLSTDAALKGSWYIKEMGAALRQGRITNVPYDPALPVDTDWDLGMVDAMTVIFSQSLRSGEVRIIDYYEAEGEAFPHFVKVLSEKPYVYGKHYPPHDATVKELGSGKSRVEVARGLGLKFEWPDPNPGVLSGIDAARLLLAKCWFDKIKTARLIECLRQYRKSFNARLDAFTGVPGHNWASHGADAFRNLAVRHRIPVEKKFERSIPAVPREFAWS
jgi:phage terminase large subunit